MTDLGMPHVDGRQIAGVVKAAAPSDPVNLLTGWGQRLMTVSPRARDQLAALTSDSNNPDEGAIHRLACDAAMPKIRLDGAFVN